MLKIYEDIIDKQTRNLERDSKMWIYIDKLVDLMKQEPQKDNLIVQLEKFKKQLKTKL